ncbi:hypothetical protein [Klebsiella pneumoniae]|nr:hypothetical protein [Klebsiella pneumoniae]
MLPRSADTAPPSVPGRSSSRIGFRPLQQDAQPAAAAQLAGYIFDLEGYSRRLHGFAHPNHPHRGVK